MNDPMVVDDREPRSTTAADDVSGRGDDGNRNGLVGNDAENPEEKKRGEEEGEAGFDASMSARRRADVAAAKYGRMEVLQWARANGCPCPRYILE